MKTLIFVPAIRNYFFSEVQDDNIYIYEEPFISEKNRILKLVQRVLKRIGNWRLYSLFFGGIKERLLNSDKCIVFDQVYSKSLISIIRKFNPQIQIIIYIWNPIKSNVGMVRELKSNSNISRIYSFDKGDCKKYNFKFLPMVYNFDNRQVTNSEVSKSVLFVGFLKDRANILSEIYSDLEKRDIKCDFYVLPSTKSDLLAKELPFKIEDKFLSYEKYKQKIKKVKAILEISQSDQIGLTIRAMESLYFNKKLISNNKDLLNYDFYNKNNIFILGIDDNNYLSEFLETEYQEIDNKILQQYNFTDCVQQM